MRCTGAWEGSQEGIFQLGWGWKMHDCTEPRAHEYCFKCRIQKHTWCASLQLDNHINFLLCFVPEPPWLVKLSALCACAQGQRTSAARRAVVLPHQRHQRVR